MHIRNGIGFQEGSWTNENLRRIMGDVLILIFGLILGCRVFHSRSGLWLFQLSMNQRASVADMFSLRWGEEEKTWNWTRRLFALVEESVGECKTLLSNVMLQVSNGDH